MEIIKNAEFYKMLSERTGLDIKQCELAMKEAENIIAESIANDKAIHFYKFGKFIATFHKGYDTSSPLVKDGKVKVDDYYKVDFVPMGPLKDRVNQVKFPERYKHG